FSALVLLRSGHSFSFFFNDPATAEIYTLSLHDALPILGENLRLGPRTHPAGETDDQRHPHAALLRPSLPLEARLRVQAERLRLADRKSTRLNSSHVSISYAVFCLKKKKQATVPTHTEPP